ncbi:hypothetical protein [Salinarchaeum laminariae]|uniref:hypothetical protein n=1 Tax=Salinarchaeum laminariae TaxID=869888 RepID=UPI0020BF1235|nr:hypothetical protein [Salinarchaeum laminariae]
MVWVEKFSVDMDVRSSAVELAFWTVAVAVVVYTALNDVSIVHGVGFVVVLRALLLGERIERNLR